MKDWRLKLRDLHDSHTIGVLSFSHPHFTSRQFFSALFLGEKSSNPRPRTSNFCLYVCLRKSFWLLSTPKIKSMILPPRIVVVFLVISSNHLYRSDKFLQGLSSSIFFFTWFFNSSHKTVFRNFLSIMDSPYQGFWRFEFQFRCFWFRFDIQSVVCVHGVGLNSSWLCLMVFLISFRGHTFFVSMYMSFA